MNLNVYLDSIGCRLNQSEIERYAREFAALGHSLVPTMAEADLMVLNTCAVTAKASSDSRQKLRQAHRAGIDQIVVTGCWSTLEPETADAFPGVIRNVPNLLKDSLAADFLSVPADDMDLSLLERQAVPGSRLRTRAFIKAQDGCDNRCTFCITTVARGSARSIPISQVVDDVLAAEDAGVKEAALTGVHLGSWGKDLSRKLHLRNLLEALLEKTSIPRIRVSSIEPWNISPDFFDLWQDERLCPHIHLPLQSGCGDTLQRMARKNTPESFAELVQAAKSRIPDAAVTTDIIVGFPGETDEEFEKSLDFVRRMAFAGGHVFTYSERDGTAAARMKGHVHNFTRKERSQIMRTALEEAENDFRQQFLGRKMKVLWESQKQQEDGFLEVKGLTGNYLPVRMQTRNALWNQISVVLLDSMDQKGILAIQPEYLEEDMDTADCIFCKIIKGEIPSEKVYEDDLVTAFKDNNPAAPVHILIIPNKHIIDNNGFGKDDQEMAGRMFLTVKKLAVELGIAESGYRLIMNTGPDGNQVVKHMHLHLIGGQPMQHPLG